MSNKLVWIQLHQIAMGHKYDHSFLISYIDNFRKIPPCACPDSYKILENDFVYF